MIKTAEFFQRCRYGIVCMVEMHGISSGSSGKRLALELAAWIIQRTFGWLRRVARVLDSPLPFVTWSPSARFSTRSAVILVFSFIFLCFVRAFLPRETREAGKSSTVSPDFRCLNEALFRLLGDR